MDSNFSTAEENYIKAIYHLQQSQSIVNTNALAFSVNTSAASVSDMLKKLKQKKIVEYEKYQGFKLSPLGIKTALTIIRKHRLWEYFLVEKLQFGWHEVHEVAEELEHITSQKLIDKLDDFLGNPKYDPHGDPIPDNKGRMAAQPQIILSALPINKKSTISAVAQQSNQLLELLKHKSIAIGTSIEVLQKFDFDKSIEVKINNKNTFNISEQVAGVIYVIPQTK